MMDLLSFELTLAQTLEDGVTRAFERLTTDRVIADVDQRVKRRTERGEFLDGSDPNAGRYQSSSHKKARERKGVPIDHVDLFFGESDMLKGTRHRVGHDATELSIEYGYLDTLSPNLPQELATYHQETGRVIRRFVGLTEDEGDQVLDDLARDYGAALGDVLGGSLQ